MFGLRINATNQLEVHAVRPDKLYTYDSHGNLLSEAKVSPYFQFGPDETTEHAEDGKGNQYVLHAHWWYPHVVKTTPAGNPAIIITTPWYKWIWMGPMPAWLVFAAGMLSLGRQNGLKTKAIR
jgi:hypothetical protein